MLAVIIIVVSIPTAAISSSTIAVGPMTTAPFGDLDLGWAWRRLREALLSLWINSLTTQRGWGILECHKGISSLSWMIRRHYVRRSHHFHVRLVISSYFCSFVLKLVLRILIILSLKLACLRHRLRPHIIQGCECRRSGQLNIPSCPISIILIHFNIII